MRAGVLRGLAALVLVGDLVLLLVALYLAFELEATEVAAERSAKGQAVAVPAALSLVAAVLTMVWGRRPRAVIGLVVAVALAVVSLMVLLLREVPPNAF